MRQSSVRPSSTKNAEKARDPEMRQTKKGNQWYFGMKARLGVDSRSKQRRAGFRQSFHEDFDCPRLGRFVLGRFSRILSPSERKEFLRLFEYYVVATYSDRLSEYVGGGVAARVIGSRLDPDGTIVSSEFNRGSGPSTAGAIRVDWRLTRHHHVYRVKDLIIDGLSMAANGRSELEGVVERNGGQPRAILAVMRQETALLR